ncbi:MAG: hypothetical protein HN348_06920, partial [Proteobacteria bacterium]|nr:hypothetical protein [Pseudomonadota bacterium]
MSVLFALAVGVIGIVAAMVLGALFVVLGDGGAIAASLMMGTAWAMSATIGSLIVMAMDTVISKLVIGFRRRILVAILGLAGIATAAGVGALFFGLRIVRGVVDGTIRNAGVSFGDETLEGADLQAYLATDAGFWFVVLVFAGIVAFL